MRKTLLRKGTGSCCICEAGIVLRRLGPASSPRSGERRAVGLGGRAAGEAIPPSISMTYFSLSLVVCFWRRLWSRPSWEGVTASTSRSAVRMRTAVSTLYAKILPSPGEPHLDTAAHDLRDRHAANVFGNQCLFDVLEFLLADDGFHFIHSAVPPLVIQSVEGRVGAFAVLCDVETDLFFLLGNSQRSDPLREEDA